MYLRTVVRKTKTGEARYLQLAHNVRHRDTGVVTAQILYNFGRAERVDRAALERLVRSVQRFLDPQGLTDVRRAAELAEADFLSARSLGGCWALDWLWKRLGIAAAVQRVLPAEQERLIFALVANRALAPTSKLSVTDWLADEVFVPGLSPVALPGDKDEREAERKRRVNALYSAMDALAAVEQELQRQVFWAISEGDLLRLEVDLLYFDTTTTYWEVEPLDAPEVADESDESGEEVASAAPEPKAWRRWSRHSKDRRPELPQIVIGLAVTRDGIPIRCWTWPGNTADVTLIQQVKRDLIGWKLGRVITVVDRGFVSEENLRVLQQNGGHYIAGERMRAGKPAVEAVLARPGRYQTVRDNIQVKEIVVGDGERRQRFVLVRNPFEAERDRRQREHILAYLREQLADLAQKEGEEHTKRVCGLRAHPVYGRYLTTDGRGRLKIDQDKVRSEERLDGKYLLRTSDDTLSSEDVALGYRQLLEVEAAFRTLKTTLELRPVYHRLEERIRSHVVLCWLALLLVRVAEVKTGESWSRLRRHLETMHLIRYRTAAGELARRTATTPAQRRVLGALGAPEPQLVFALDPAADPPA